jgi:tight adherence protein B
MMYVLLVIAALVIVGGIVALLSDADRNKVATNRRLKSLTIVPAEVIKLEEGGVLPSEPWLPYIPERFRDSVDDTLAATGYRFKLYHYLAMCLGSGLLMFFITLGFLHLSFSAGLLVFAVAAFLVPWYFLKSSQKKHVNNFLSIFPDAIDLMVRAVRAGLPVGAALDAAGKEISDPVGQEFRMIVADMRIGLDLEEALQRAGARVRLSDFSFFVASLVLQKESGGNLSETLQILSSVLRRRSELRLKLHAMTAEARTSAIVIGCLPFLSSLALAVLNPSYLSSFSTNPNGAYVLGAAAAMMTMGALVMRSMIESAMK